MSDIELKPCPFCGGNLVWSKDYREFRHPLAKCMLTGLAFSDTAEKVIASWNTRYKPKSEELFDQQIAEYVKRGKP